MLDKNAKREQLVKDAVKDTKIECKKAGKGYRLTVPVPGDRKQFVRVLFETSEFEHAPIVCIETTCGKSAPDGYRWALQQNRSLAMGAIGLDMINGAEHFVLEENLLENEITPKSLHRAIVYVARMGDKVEFKLTGQDKF